MSHAPARVRPIIFVALSLVGLLGAGPDLRPGNPSPPGVRMNNGATAVGVDSEPAKPPAATPTPTVRDWLPGADEVKGLRQLALITMGSLIPVAVLIFTPFVRIHIILTLLRQAMGSPQVPGNQVLMALALLLTGLVMRPVGETVYKGAIAPYAAHQLSPEAAWEAGSRPIKNFMVDQIERTGHTHYLFALYDYAEPDTTRRVEPRYKDEYPLHVIATAFLLSELTTALLIGFMLYLPFLVVDLVVSAVLSAMGLFMLPPTLVAMPLKLILFVLADGWLLVATSLLQTFRV